ncbi:murein biosynthesis integral membrane protein MurJ [Candidatus Methylomirabilis limnetica]|uniref:Probable lipid II flippase MurJ n=2 Tax=Candidatus Methylomirabilis limnetica TaxID=2033718 RepID=A0A2T4TZI0_9BACT|nr:murein biosynthesis integral membrane protein MurJ [Candidatus Methylomirabilis limnetica]
MERHSLVKEFLMEQERPGKIVRAAGVVSGATLLSRILGFVRDLIIARTFGAGTATDAFFAAFRLPNMLRELLGEGALSAAFIPVFTEAFTKRGRESAWRLAWTILTLLALLLVLISIAGILLAPWLVRLIAPGFQSIPEKLHLAIYLTRLMFPYILFIGVAALFMGILNSQGHFATPALSPSILNIAMIGCALFLTPYVDPPIMALAIGVLIGGVGQLLVQIPVVWRRGMGAHRGFDLSDPAVGRITRLMTPGVAGLAVTQVNVFVGTLLASLMGEGGISILYYAFRLIQLPIGVFGVAIATAAFPAMARQAASRSLGEVGATVAYAIRLVLFVTLPAMVGLMVFRIPIVQLLFERGAFDRTVTLATAEVVLFYAFGLGAYVSNRILVPAFYSLQDTATPVKIGMVAVMVNIASSLLLMRPMGLVGLALATSLSSFVNLGLLLIVLRRRLGQLPGLSFRSLAPLGGAAVAMALIAVSLVHFRDPVTVEPVLRRAGLLTFELVASFTVFLAAAACMGSEELKGLLQWFIGWRRRV